MTNQDITKYFLAEKSESLFFILLGIVAIGVAVYGLVFQKTAFVVGAAIPMVLVGLIQLVVGTSVYFRSDKDIARVSQMMQQERTKIATEELPRMQVVNKNFDVYKTIEIILLITGLLLVAFFYKQVNSFWLGLGITLSIESAIMLVLDFFAERRADIYTALLERFLP
jgi:hypothetical protein